MERPRFHCLKVLLDLVADEEVVNKESDPAECEDGDGQDDLPKEVEFGLLEDVEYAPDCGDEADYINDSC